MNKPLILTYTGKHVNPLDLQPEDIDIFDIAHALAQCNRFAGHARKPINVAQHSIYVERVVAERTSDISIRRQALLHDASEAYLGDVTKWLKAMPEFAAYREAEERIQTQIYMHFGCSPGMHSFVAEADKLMLRFEGEKGFPRSWVGWREALPNYPLLNDQEKALVGPWAHWTYRESEGLFLVAARSVGLFEETYV